MPARAALPVSLLPALLLFGCPGDKSPPPEDDTGEPVVDADGDGFSNEIDCDDSSAAVNPSADERCNGLDDDCDGEIDEHGAVDGSTYYPDNDADGYGDDSAPLLACGAEDDITTVGGDCDDADDRASPAHEELCDEIDNDCDGEVDEPGTSDGSTYSVDNDGDGFGHPVNTGVACGPGDGFADNALDCDDGDPARNPDAEEVCDEEDNDCDGEIDEDVTSGTLWYTDLDSDGYGQTGTGVVACDQLPGTAAEDGDCDDEDPAVHPGAVEREDGLDNDCDGDVDEIPTSYLSVRSNFQYGEGTSASDRDCDLWWDVVGTPAVDPCTECDWSFDAFWDYDESVSDNTGLCVDEATADFEFGLGFDRDLYGYGISVAWYGYDGEWFPAWYADWDPKTYEFTFYVGYYEYRTGRTYYTNWWNGYGTAIP